MASLVFTAKLVSLNRKNKTKQNKKHKNKNNLKTLTTVIFLKYIYIKEMWKFVNMQYCCAIQKVFEKYYYHHSENCAKIEEFIKYVKMCNNR